MSSRNVIAALAVAAAAATLVMAGCGGGVGSGGTGVVPTVAQGTVSGFGSVFVDGQRYDDSLVGTLREDQPGVDTLTAARMGDHVEVQSDDQGRATSLRVEATLIGSVDAVAAPGQFAVLGQPVIVNSDPAAGPVTQFGGGYTGAADLVAADSVEVHGSLVPQAGAVVVRATRIDKLAALPAYLKVTGVVASLGNNDFHLGALTVHAATATVVPAGSTLANGELVTVLARPTGLAGSAAAPELNAAQVRVKTLGMAGDAASVGGSIAALDTVGSSFKLGTLTVRYAGATLSPPMLALVNGQYVRVRGKVLADGSLQADTVTLRDGRNEAEAELKGSIVGYVAATQHFSVRGVDVDASAATVQGCPNGALAEGLYVQVEGSLTATGVRASKVACEDAPQGATVGRRGLVSSVDLTTSSFVLTPSTGAPITVFWTTNTYFQQATPQTLAGKRVQVEGTLAADGTLTAKQVEVDD